MKLMHKIFNTLFQSELEEVKEKLDKEELDKEITNKRIDFIYKEIESINISNSIIINKMSYDILNEYFKTNKNYNKKDRFSVNNYKGENKESKILKLTNNRFLLREDTKLYKLKDNVLRNEKEISIVEIEKYISGPFINDFNNEIIDFCASEINGIDDDGECVKLFETILIALDNKKILCR